MSTKSIEEMLIIYEQANRAYHTGDSESPLSDKEFDDLRVYLISKLGKDHPILRQVGSVESMDRVPLPRPMGSLEKIHPNGEVEAWLLKLIKEERLVITPKLDGCSLELGYDKNTGFLIEAYTRGDGFEGCSVIRHALNIPSIPKQIKIDIDLKLHGLSKVVYVRGEVYLEDATFDKLFKKSETNKEGYKNPRNMVAGVLRRKKPDAGELHHFKFKTYSLVDSTFDKLDQLLALQNISLPVVTHFLLSAKKTTNEILTDTLKVWKREIPVSLDGLVVEVNDYSVRTSMGLETNSLNPVFARAFKTSEMDNKAVATVTSVEWNPSKDGYLIPRLVLEPLELGGVTITHATAHNAKYVEDNEIGAGSEILITRSGDVIPYVVEVQSPGTKPYLPNDIEWNWDANKVHIITKEETDEQRIQKLVFFFTTLGVDYFSIGTIAKFYFAGFNTVKRILEMSEDDMVNNIEGIKEKTAKKIRESIEAATSHVYLPTLMDASGCFGRLFGTTKSELLYNLYKNDLLKINLEAVEVQKIRGFDTTAKQAVEGLEIFKEWLENHKRLFTVGKWEDFQAKVTEDKFGGAVFVFTGFRDTSIEDKIVSLGGKIGSGVSKNTTYLVCKSLDSGSSKVQKAKDLGVKVLSKEELLKLF